MDPGFAKHFDGKRFYNPDAPQAPGLLDVLRWKLTSRPEPSPSFISDVEQSIPPRRVEGSGLRITLVNHSTVLLQQRGLQHFDGPDLVRTAESCVVDRSAAPEKAGSILGGSAADRRRAHQPQSLRPPGSADTAPAGGSWRFHIHRSGWRRPAAALGEYRAGSRAGLGRIVCAPGRSPSTACRLCISRAGEFSTATRTLWCGYVIECQERLVYFAGDTAFGHHFAQIREQFGSPRLALLPIGAYEPRWFMSPVHMAPDEAVRAHQILGAEDQHRDPPRNFPTGG